MHTNGLHGIERTEISQLLLEVLNGFRDIAVSERHVLVVIAYFVPHSCNLTNDIGLVAVRHDTEIIRGAETHFCLYLCCSQAILCLQVHIMPQDNERSIYLYAFLLGGKIVL